MSKYTTELRFICEHNSGLTNSSGYADINTILENSYAKIFSFDFPIFDEHYRKPLCIKILKHYYTREISEESYGLWKLRLDAKMNEIMPYYNQLYKSELLEFNPLDDVNYTRTHEGEGSNKGTSTNSTTSKDNTTSNANTTAWDLYSDTPQGGVDGFDNNDDNMKYLTNARKNTDNTSNTSEGITSTTGAGESDFNTTDKYVETVAGLMGHNTYSAKLLEFRKTFLNIDMQIIDELNVLFMGLW